MTGVEAGSVVAALSSFAATSPIGGAVLGSAAAPAILGGAGAGVGVAALGAGIAVALSQSWHIENPPTPDRPYFIAVHDYGTVRVTSHDTYEAAKKDWISRIDSPLRRILFHLHGTTSPNGIWRPWTELKHDGMAPWVDDGMRHALHQSLRDTSRIEGSRPGKPGHPYFIAVHDYGVVRVTNYASYEAAHQAWLSRIGSPLRRILFHLDGKSSPNNVKRPWIELKHDGDAPWVDDGMRDALQAALP